MNAIIPVLKMPEMHSGKSTSTKVCILPAPSTNAASSRTFGIFRKKDMSSHTENGNVTVRWPMMIPR